METVGNPAKIHATLYTQHRNHRLKVYKNSGDKLNIVSPRSGRTRFPVVSAEDACSSFGVLRELCSHLSVLTEMASVLALHLTPKFQDDVAALLQRNTLLFASPSLRPVAIRQDHVYVITPLCDVVMFDGHLPPLRLRRVVVGRHGAMGLIFHMPAKAHSKIGLAVVFSGARKNEASCIKHVRNADGLVAVQSTTAASVYEMPLATVASDHINVVLPVGDIARLIDCSNSLSTWRAVVCHRTSQRQPFGTPRRLSEPNQTRRSIHQVQLLEEQVQRRAIAISQAGVVLSSTSMIKKWQATRVNPHQIQRSWSLPMRLSWVAEVVKAASGQAKESGRQTLVSNGNVFALRRHSLARSRVAGKSPNCFFVPGHHSGVWLTGMRNSSDRGSLHSVSSMMQQAKGTPAKTNKSAQRAVVDLKLLPIDTDFGCSAREGFDRKFPFADYLSTVSFLP